MAKMPNIDDTLEVTRAEKMPCAEGFRMAMEGTGSRMATETGTHLEIAFTVATTHIGETP